MLNTEDRIKKEAEKFHEANPHVYELFDQRTHDIIRRGHKRYRIITIWARVHWELSLENADPKFKIPDKYATYYARMWQMNHREYPNFFWRLPRQHLN